MAWEERNGKNYYYAKRWINGTCHSEYIGSGMFAGAIADLDYEKQFQAKFERDKRNAERQEIEKLDSLLDEISETNNFLVKALFLINGYHTHKYEWRKKRKPKQTKHLK
jgi:hypothetical protein